ncbi:SIR2 family NAD-dependent protein deacylase [Blastochloris tepida]|uniref:Transcriptional regulator n=1 Tax=Blastochloris tepida TaxID=2233851 RepID=A0A348FYW7_9HYPH|nr:SIR2 family protein [Blastochloris tepida]BBF92500.1 transcriptional regulator [Blastochloris tepida]
MTGVPAPLTFADIRDGFAAGRLVPYLGAGVFGTDCAVPTTPIALSHALNARVAVSGRIRDNLWQTAQFIESRRHRKTLNALMAEIFRPEVAPTALHRHLATLKLPLIVDTWYDGAMRAALLETGRTDWCEVQGVTRSGEDEDIWTRTFDAAGEEIDPGTADRFTTVLYKPHGAVGTRGTVLVSDSDYVEVLTEIDIQTPIPEVVKARRSALGFVFLGCRFDDQMLRTFARQIAKRSAGPNIWVAEDASLTRNERAFLAEQSIALIDAPLGDALAALAG